MTKIELIEKIAGMYTLNTRSIGIIKERNELICMYNTPDGKTCAFGFCVKPESRHKLIEIMSADHHFFKNILTRNDLVEGIPFDRGLFQSLQWLHDNPENWNESGLSEKGIQQVNLLKLKYA